MSDYQKSAQQNTLYKAQTLIYMILVYVSILSLFACATNSATEHQQQTESSFVSNKEATENLAAANNDQASVNQLPIIEKTLEEQWGVEVVGIRQSAAGYMLDFRYRVLDAEKATPLLDRRIKPELVVAKSGATLKVPVPPKIGALRQSAKFVKADRNYFILFSNPGRHVIPGDQVSVVIGEFKAENLTVQ